jgi:hypothetical protein
MCRAARAIDRCVGGVRSSFGRDPQNPSWILRAFVLRYVFSAIARSAATQCALSYRLTVTFDRLDDERHRWSKRPGLALKVDERVAARAAAGAGAVSSPGLLDAGAAAPVCASRP